MTFEAVFALTLALLAVLDKVLVFPVMKLEIDLVGELAPDARGVAGRLAVEIPRGSSLEADLPRNEPLMPLPCRALTGVLF